MLKHFTEKKLRRQSILGEYLSITEFLASLIDLWA
jgi:hypothetical protein